MKILEMAHGIIWGPWTVGIFLIVGLVLSVRCHFFQILGFKYWWNPSLGFSTITFGSNKIPLLL